MITVLRTEIPSIVTATLVATSLFAAPAVAQFQHPDPLPDVLLVNDAFGSTTPNGSYDLYEDQVFRLADFDGDRTYEGQLETSLLFEFGQSPNYKKSWQILGVRSRIENGEPAVYFTNNRDGSQGSSGNYVAEVWRGVDVNDDGLITIDEATLIADMEQVLGGSQGAEGVALTPAGNIWASTDYPGGGLVRFANGVPTVYVDEDDAPYKVPGKFGSPVTIDTDDFTRLTPWGDDGVLVYSDGFGTAKDEAIHGFRDLNGDGDILDDGEAVCFLNATGANTALLKNPDFGVSLRSMVISHATSSYCWLKEMATMIEPPTEKDGEPIEAHFFASNSSNSGSFSINENGEFVNGLIFRAVDANGNGTVNDTGEVGLYYDGSGDGGSIEQLDKILGIDVYEQSVLVFYLNGGSKTVIVLTDMNGDGDAMDPGERIDPWNEFNVLSAPWKLFFFGTALGVMEPGYLPKPVSRQASFAGNGCAPDGGGIPRLSAQGDASVGSVFCELQILDGPPSQFAYLFLSASDRYFGQALPVDLATIGLVGCQLHTDLAYRWFTALDGAGEATFPLAAGLQNPNLAGIELTFQAVTIDGLGVTATPSLGITGGMTLAVPESL